MDEQFSKWERIMLRTAGLILLAIAITKIIAGEVGPLIHR
jgi:hypothetical protein